MTDDPRTYLGQTGQIYVTLAAARQYAEATHRERDIETARRELTERLLEATPVAAASDSGAEQWRFRRRSAGVDLTVHVSREGALAVVTHARVRGYRPPLGGARR